MSELHTQAMALVELRRWSAADELLRRMLASDPDDAQALCLLSQVALGANDAGRALALARRAIACEPDSDWPYRLAAVALSRLGQHDAAVRAASRAVDQSPDGWPALTCLARAAAHPRASRKRLGLAESAAARAVASAPEVSETHLAQGAVALARGQRKRAQAAYARAAALDPAAPAVQNELARLQLVRGRLGRPASLDKAAAGFAGVAAADPTSPIGRRNLDLTLRLFLGRVAYAIFFVVLVAGQGSDAIPPRPVPPAVLLLLLVPVIIAARFVARLSPALRSHLLQLVGRWPVCIAMSCELLSAAALVAATTRPPASESYWTGPALVLAVAGRLVLAGKRSTTTTPILVAIGFGCAAAGALLLLVASTPGGGRAGVVGTALILAATVPLGTVLHRRRGARRQAAGLGPPRPQVGRRR